MVSKNEKSPDDSEKSDNNVRIDEEEDILAGNSYLLQVPVKKKFLMTVLLIPLLLTAFKLTTIKIQTISFRKFQRMKLQ